MPIGASIALTAAPGVFQLFKGLRQNKEANRLKYKDLTPEAFKEQLATARLDANNQRFVGEGAAVDRINMGAANGLNNAIQAGTGSAGILATLGQLDRNRNSAFMQLGNQAAQYQQQNKGRLTQALGQQAQYQTASRDAFERQRAALKEAGSRNEFGGISTLAGAGVMGATGGFKAQAAYNNQIANGMNPNLNSENTAIINNAPSPVFNQGYGAPGYRSIFDLPGTKSYNPNSPFYYGR